MVTFSADSRPKIQEPLALLELRIRSPLCGLPRRSVEHGRRQDKEYDAHGRGGSSQGRGGHGSKVYNVRRRSAALERREPTEQPPFHVSQASVLSRVKWHNSRDIKSFWLFSSGKSAH